MAFAFQRRDESTVFKNRYNDSTGFKLCGEAPGGLCSTGNNLKKDTLKLKWTAGLPYNCKLYNTATGAQGTTTDCADYKNRDDCIKMAGFDGYPSSNVADDNPDDGLCKWYAQKDVCVATDTAQAAKFCVLSMWGSRFKARTVLSTAAPTACAKITRGDECCGKPPPHPSFPARTRPHPAHPLPFFPPPVLLSLLRLGQCVP